MRYSLGLFKKSCHKCVEYVHTKGSETHIWNLLSNGFTVNKMHMAMEFEDIVQ